MELEVHITAKPAEFRAAIDHLAERERATLRQIHDHAVIDLREHAATAAD
jgi:hypothetical protein